MLDTSVVRLLGRSESAGSVAAVLRWLTAYDFSLHLADPAMVELVNQLKRGQFAWDDWQRAKPELVAMIDPDEPILPGGVHLLADLLTTPPPGHGPQLKQELRDEERAAWLRLLRAESADGLESVAPAQINGRAVLAGTRAHKAGGILDEVRGDFAEHVAEARRLASADPVAIRAELLKAERGLFSQLDEIGRGEPPLSKRLDARIKYDLRKYALALQRRNPYNPSSPRNRNDAIDAGLLDYLALPALVCTADAILIRDVRLTGSPQVAWMIDVGRERELDAAPPSMEWDALDWVARRSARSHPRRASVR